MSERHPTNDQALDLQCWAEAHLYIAVAKADGIVSRKERAGIGACAVKAQKLYDVLDINSEIARRVKEAIRKILSDARYRSWNTGDHVDEAFSLLKQACDLGNWSVALERLKQEQGLLQVALLDEYVFAESVAVKEILGRLEQALNGVW
jgi:hypothetical protein